MAPDVAGPITVNLTKIKLKEALRLIAEENGYSFRWCTAPSRWRSVPLPSPSRLPPPRFEVGFEDNKLSVDLQKIPVRPGRSGA